MRENFGRGLKAANTRWLQFSRIAFSRRVETHGCEEVFDTWAGPRSESSHRGKSIPGPALAHDTYTSNPDGTTPASPAATAAGCASSSEFGNDSCCGDSASPTASDSDGFRFETNRFRSSRLPVVSAAIRRDLSARPDEAPADDSRTRRADPHAAGLWRPQYAPVCAPQKVPTYAPQYAPSRLCGVLDASHGCCRIRRTSGPPSAQQLLSTFPRRHPPPHSAPPAYSGLADDADGACLFDADGTGVSPRRGDRLVMVLGPRCRTLQCQSQHRGHPPGLASAAPVR